MRCTTSAGAWWSYAKRVGAKAIVIGRNECWKQGIRLGKRTNQSFVQIPYHVLIGQIRYKAEELGIEVVLTEGALHEPLLVSRR
jgi:putative transposase